MGRGAEVGEGAEEREGAEVGRGAEEGRGAEVGKGAEEGEGAEEGKGAEAEQGAEAQSLVRALLSLGPRIVVLTGGHCARAVDLFLDGAGDGQIVEIPGRRHPDGAAHGSGCTHSSVLAAQLALGHTPLEAARTARSLAGAAVAHGLRDIGAGPGPVDVLGLPRLRSR